MFRLKNIEITRVYIVFSLFFILLVALEKKYNFRVYPVRVFLSKLPDKKQQINNEIIDLNSQIANLKKENEYLSKYSNIYKNLKGIHSIKSIAEVKYISDTVNGRHLIAYADKSVKNNDLVVDDKNILLGRVVRVGKENDIKVQLLSDVYSNIPVYIGNSYGIVYGTNDKNCKIAFQKLSNSAPKEGDVVITSGFENLTIRGVIVGTIGNFDSLNGTWCVNNNNIDYIDKIVIIGD